MVQSDRAWPARRGRRKPLDVLAAYEELSMLLRRRCIDGVEAEAGTPAGPDATRHITLYSKALDGLTKLQFDMGHLERIAPGRAGPREAVPSGQSVFDYSLAERERMQYGSITKGMTPPEPSGEDQDAIPSGK